MLAHIMYAVYMYVYIDSNICGDRTWNHIGMSVECAIATQPSSMTGDSDFTSYVKLATDMRNEFLVKNNVVFVE